MRSSGPRAIQLLMALVTLTDGQQARVMAFHRLRDVVAYNGLRELSPGMAVDLVIDIGPRGGRRTVVTKRR